MKIDLLIERLQEMQKENPNAEVKLHGKDGNNVLFVVAYKDNNDVVVLEDRSDNDLSCELDERIKQAGTEKVLTDPEFYKGLFRQGFTVEDLEDNLSGYDYEIAMNTIRKNNLV